MERRHYDLRQERLFLLAYSFWLINAITGITVWDEFYIIDFACIYIQRASYLILAGQFLMKRRYTKKDVAGIAFIIIIIIWGFYSVNNRYIIDTAILIYFSADIDFRKILKCTLAIQSAFMVITVFASQFNVIENVIWGNTGYTLRVRESLGYDYCAYTSHLLLFLTLVWFCLKRKADIWDSVGLLILNYYIYRLTDSRADFYLAITAIVGMWIWNGAAKSRFLKKIASWFMRYGCGVMAFFSIALQCFYQSGSPGMAQLNTALSGRLKLGYDAIQQYGFSLLGKKIKWYGMGSIKTDSTLEYNYVDCAFLKETLTYGILFLAVLIIAFYLIGKKISDDGDYILGCAIVVSLLYATINAHLCMPVFNVFILYLGRIFANYSKDSLASRSNNN